MGDAAHDRLATRIASSRVNWSTRVSATLQQLSTAVDEQQVPQRNQQQQEQQHRCDAIFDKLPSLDALRAVNGKISAAPAAMSLYLSTLQSSRPFYAADFADALATALGVDNVYSQLRGSLLRPLPAAPAVATAARELKLRIDDAWSSEAVKRGVAHAKSGDFEVAAKCYEKALELNPQNADARVARGAAAANQHRFEEASKDFRAALQLDPGNSNASKYLQAVAARMQQQPLQAQLQNMQQLQGQHAQALNAAGPGAAHTPPLQGPAVTFATSDMPTIAAASIPDPRQASVDERLGNSRSKHEDGSDGCSSDSLSSRSSSDRRAHRRLGEQLHAKPEEIQEALRLLREKAKKSKHKHSKRKHHKKGRKR